MNPKWIGIGLLVLGSLVIFLALQKFPTSRFAAPRELGSVEMFRGQALLFRGTEKKEILERATLYERDRLETAFDAEATVELLSGFKMKVMPNTGLTLQRENDKIQLVIGPGDLNIEIPSPVVQILRDGQLIDSAQYQPLHQGIVIEVTPISGIPTIEEKPAPSKTTPVLEEPPQPPVTPSSEDLTEAYITSVLQAQRQNFFKCYSQVLQKNPEAKGKVALSFTIVDSGKISQSEVVQSTFEDETFHRCLLQVLSRVSFHSYEGKPVTTLFPLKFE